MRLRDVIDGLPLSPVVSGDAEVTDIAQDTREIGPGSIFVARVGSRVDGHTLIDAAVARGAVAVVGTDLDALSRSPVPALLAMPGDDESWIGELAARVFDRPFARLVCIGVTGTNGKTTTTSVIAHLLNRLGIATGLIGTVGYRFGRSYEAAPNTTPDGIRLQRLAAQWLNDGARAVVMEASSHGLQLGRVGGVWFDGVGFTNLTVDHLDFHGTMDAYRAAKALLFTREVERSVAAGKSPFGAFCVEAEGGEAMLRAASARLRSRAVTSKPRDGQPLVASRVASLGALGQRIAFRRGDESAEAAVVLPGDYNLQNVGLAVSLVADVTGRPLAEVVAGLDGFAGVAGRFELVATPREGEPAIFRDYAHTPDAVERSASLLADAAGRPAVVVLGCGGDRDRTKRGPMLDAALRQADEVIVTSDNPRGESPAAIVEEMLAAATLPTRSATVELDRSRAIERSVSAPGAVAVLIAGKGHEHYQEVAGRKYHLDDAEEARRALAAHRVGQRARDIQLCRGWSPERWADELQGEVRQRGFGGPYGPLVTDSRAVGRDGVFVALRGERFDAHSFVDQVVSAGAGLLVVDRDVALPDDAKVDVVRVEDTTRALGRLASGLVREARHRWGGLAVVAVTGSNGKTTTKEMLGRVVVARFGREALVTSGNLNNHIGVPLTLARLTPSHRHAVIEMGANRPGDIAELAGWVRPDVGVVTSIGYAHTEGLGGLGGVRETKAGVFDGGQARVAVLPHAEVEREPQWRRWAESRGVEVLTFGAEAGATLRATRETADADVLLEASGPLAGWSARVTLGLPGIHNATNLAAAILGAASLELPVRLPEPRALVEALAGLSLPAGRLQRLQLAGRVIVDDAYNANPSSMAASLALLAEERTTRVAVLGDMYEIGADERAQHEHVGRIAGKSADLVVAVGPRARWIAEGAREVGGEAVHVADTREAAAWLSKHVAADAVIWVKASRGMKLETIIDQLRAVWGGS
jgi:murE/murF fusion protein